MGVELLDGGDWIAQDVDILLPCALENQITPDTLAKISDQVKVICEGANGPTTPDSDEIIKAKIFILSLISFAMPVALPAATLNRFNVI